jgi:hypothetical protein
MESVDAITKRWWEQTPQELEGWWGDELSTKDLDVLDWDQLGFIGRMPTPEIIELPWLIISYLSQVEENPDARAAALESGAEPTEGEKAAWKACLDDGSAYDSINDCVRIEKVELPEGTIWWVSHEEGLGQGTDVLRSIGPFKTLDSAMSQAWEWAKDWHETMTDGCFDEECEDDF